MESSEFSSCEKDSSGLDITKCIKKLASGEPTPSPINIFVYRLGSFASATGSKRSRLSSVFSQKAVSAYIERTFMTSKEWMILAMEMFIAFAWFIIRNRRRRNSDLLRRGLTERMELMDIYLKRAQSAPGAILVGYLADSYVDIYPIALANVVLHFFVSILMCMEEVIKWNDYDLYQGIVSQTVGFSLIPLKATDFARLVFGLKQLGRKNVKVVVLFIFFSLWLNERSCGGVLIPFIGFLRLSVRASVQISFIVCGIASFFYLYILRPEPDKITVIPGIGNKIIGCIFSALWLKKKLGGRVNTNSWIDLAGAYYEKVYVTKTKQLLGLYSMILPTVGFSLFITTRSDLYVTLWQKMKPTGLFVYTGVMNGARAIALTSMFLLGVIIVPLLSKTGLKFNFFRRFILGYVFALFCYFYASTHLRFMETFQPKNHFGLLRIFNTRNESIQVASRNKEILAFNYTVDPLNNVIVGVEVYEETLFEMLVKFDVDNFTTFFSVSPNKVVGYVAVDPTNIYRIAGFLPIWEGPPGYNVPYMARLYFANVIPEFNITLNLERIENRFTVDTSPGNTMFNIHLSSGESKPLQVPAGVYTISAVLIDLTGDRKIIVGTGGVYIIILYSTSTEHKFVQDTMVEENHADNIITLGISIPYAVALVFSYVTLRAFLFINTPEGLEGLCFGFLETMENSTSWVIWIGFQTWHPFVSSHTITIYSVVLTLMFFLCLFMLMKYDNNYNWC